MNKILFWLLVPLLLVALPKTTEGETAEPRGEIRVVENIVAKHIDVWPMVLNNAYFSSGLR